MNLPFRESNPCHDPQTGEFCSTGGPANIAFIEKVFAMGYENPFNQRETVIDNEIVVEVMPVGDREVYLTGLKAFQHRAGAATRLLTRLAALADELGVTLTLRSKPMPVPRGQKPIPAKKLVAFYKRFGFTGTRADMARIPRTR